MKKIFPFLCLIFVSTSHINAQETKPSNALEKPYNPTEDAQKQIDALIVKAKKEKKNIILQAGGNWCSWCLLFNDYIKKEKDIQKVLKENYLYYHLNYSKENKNEAVFKKYAPKGNDLGYPFFIVLDTNGKVLHLQESGSLEEGKGYNKQRVLAFLNKWKR